MHVRRALLLLALVIAVGAVVAALSRPEEPAGGGDGPASLRDPAPPPGARDGVGPVEVRIDARGEAKRREIPLGEAVTAIVAVERPGEVALPELGLLGFAERGAPARFDLLVDEPAEYEVRFDPLGDDPPRTVARLVARR